MVDLCVEPWNPSAEPWEALREAVSRVKDGWSIPVTPKDLSEALSGMGWVLAPNEGMFPASYARFSARIHELEAENKRLRETVSLYRYSGFDGGAAARRVFAGSPGGDEQPSQCEYVEAFERARCRVESEEGERLDRIEHHLWGETGTLEQTLTVPDDITRVDRRINALIQRLRDLEGGGKPSPVSVGDDTGLTVTVPRIDLEALLNSWVRDLTSRAAEDAYDRLLAAIEEAK